MTYRGSRHLKDDLTFLVVYKTKLKPWWKERNVKLTNTPATRYPEVSKYQVDSKY